MKRLTYVMFFKSRLTAKVKTLLKLGFYDLPGLLWYKHVIMKVCKKVYSLPPWIVATAEPRYLFEWDITREIETDLSKLRDEYSNRQLPPPEYK